MIPITMNNLAITSASKISDNLYLLLNFISRSYLVVMQVMTVPVSGTCWHRLYKRVTPTANLAKKTEIPTLQFWLESFRFWQIFPASHFHSIFSWVLNSSFLCLTSLFSMIVCCFSGISQPLLPLWYPSMSLQ